MKLDILTGEINQICSDFLFFNSRQKKTKRQIIIELLFITGLCYQDKILYHMWLFLCTLGQYCGLKAFLDHLAANTKCTAPEFQMLILFCDCMTHYVT